jgi:ATP-dependent DNA helicase RecQ
MPFSRLAIDSFDLTPVQRLRSYMEGDRRQRLRARFGLAEFHPWQAEAIDALLDGKRRVLVVAPTGGGKSLTYQFSATELEGTTIVVSPLIALMEDQVRGLSERGIAATWLSSTVEPNERRRRERELAAGAYELVYVAPERLASDYVLDMLAEVAPPLVAIDEAHCISQWGHDFRPDYLRLNRVLERLAPKHVLACTATATPIVRDEIIDNLGLRADETELILRGFARPNLHLTAREIDGTRERKRAAVDAVREALGAPTEPAGAAIVYTATRKIAEQMADVMADEGYRAAAYHAGLEPRIRQHVNAGFAAGQLDVVCATNAFGMGIDRPDIRAVVHVQSPGSIEAYYQEVGRAGRDGQPALGLLLRSTADFGLRRRLIERKWEDNQPDEERVQQQWGLFLDLMRYVEAGSCRHDFILGYFGDEQETLGGCGHCDVCERLEELGEDGERKIDDEDAIIVQKALAGVARNRRVAGLNRVIEMLHGDENVKLDRMGLSSLSTHGILADRDKPWLTILMRRLLTAGLIEITTDKYPKPYLTRDGLAAMKGEAPIRVLLPEEGAGGRKARSRRGSKKKKPAEMPTNVDRALFERLREARLELAREKGVPAYVVCHDRTLLEMAAQKPRTLGEMADVHGMGPARLEAWGDRFLSVVTES